MLRLRNVSKRFGDVQAVQDVSLDLHAGEIFGLLGPNGAGKTTTVRMMAGLLRPDGGAVELDGAGPPTARAVRHRIGVAPQTLALYGELSAAENLEFFGRLYGLAGAALRERVAWALEFVGLTEPRGRRADRYSGGMQRRLNLAIAVLHQPALLICDEPTAGVDPQSRNLLLERIRQYSAADRAVLYTTHYMEEAEKLCDRIAIMDHGRILATGTLAELLRAHGDEYTVVTEAAGGDEVRQATRDPLATLQALRQAGTLGRFRVEQPDLESLFLHLTGRRLRD